MLAKLYLQMGRYAAAEPLLKRCSLSKSKSSALTTRDTLTSGYNLAKLHMDMGRYEEAEPLLPGARQGRAEARP